MTDNNTRYLVTVDDGKFTKEYTRDELFEKSQTLNDKYQGRYRIDVLQEADINNIEDSDNYRLSVDDGNFTKTYTRDELKAKRGVLSQKYGGRYKVQAYRGSFDDINTALQSDKENMERQIDEWSANNGAFMQEYDDQKSLADQTVAFSDSYHMSPEQEYVYNNAQEYGKKRAEIEELRRKYYSNPLVIQQREGDAGFARNMAEGFAAAADRMETENPELARKAKAVRAGMFMPGRVILSEVDDDVKQYNDDLANYDTARRMAESARDIYAAPSKYDDSVGVVNFLKGGRDVAKKADFWTMGLVGIADNLNARDALMKVQEKIGGLDNLTAENIDDYLSPSEVAIVTAFTANALAQASRANDLSRGYQAGQGATESLGFMAQFLLTGGVGNTAAKGATEGMTKWLAKQLGNMSAGAVKNATRTASKGLLGTIESVTKAAVMTPIMPQTWKTISDEMVEITDEGKLQEANTAFWHGMGDAMIETWSENAGGMVENILGVPLSAGKAVWNKALGNTAFGRWGLNLTRTPAYKLMKQSGWNGFLGEMGEEWVGNTIRTVTGLDPDALKDFATVDNQIITMTSFAPMSVLGLGTSAAQFGAARKRATKAAEHLSQVMRGAGYTEEQIRFTIDDVNASTPRQLSETLTPVVNQIARDSDNGALAFKAVMEYADAVAKYRTLDGFYQREQEAQMDDAREEIVNNTGQQFWQTREVAEGVTTDNVRVLTTEEGVRMFVVGQGEDGMLAVVKENGEKAFITKEEAEGGTPNGPIPEGERISNDESLSLRDFLRAEVVRKKQTAEQERMSLEHATRISDVKSVAVPGTQINLGTEEAPIMGDVLQQTPDGVMVQADDKAILLTWEEAANAMKIGSKPMTDAEIEEQEADEIEQARAQRELERARTEQEVALASSAEEVAAVASEDAEPLPLKQDGSVDQTTLWNKSPERWARWNDEQRQDGGVNSINYINNALAKAQKDLDSAVKAYDKETDFEAREAMEEGISAKQERVARLSALQQSYLPENAQEQAAAQVAQETAGVQSPATPAESSQTAQALPAPEQTIYDLFSDESLSEDEIEAYIDANVAGSQSDLDKHLNKAPKMGRDMEKYKADKAKHEEKTRELTAIRDHWRQVRAYLNPPTVEMDMEPQNALEFTSKELTSQKGIKLLPDSFRRHTGWGSEIGSFISILRTKEKGGLTLEAAGERLMELDRENSTGFFDQNDPNAGLNAILEVLGGARTSGDISRYIKTEREKVAKEEVAAVRNAMMEEVAAKSQELEQVEDAKKLSEQEISALIDNMKANAEVATEIELTPENWIAEFGENGIVETPIGEVKMGENQLAKLFLKKREAYLGMIKPTLNNPDVIIEKAAPAEGAERETKYIFIKTFIKADGSRIVHFESVTVLKEGKEVSISSHEVQDKDIKKEMQNGKILHLNNKLSLNSDGSLTEAPIEERPDLVPTSDNVSSESKDSNNPAISNESEENVDGFTSTLDEDMPDFENMSDEEVKRMAIEAVVPETERQRFQDEKRNTLKDRIREWEQRLGAKVKIMESIDDVTNPQAKAQIEKGGEVWGWFETSTGEVCIYLPDFMSLSTSAALSEIDKTYIHEIVSHKGLRGLLGEDAYGELCDMVWEAMTEEEQQSWMQYPGVNGNTRAAADEYIAHFAENVDYNDNRTLWDKILDFIKDWFNSVEIPVKITNESMADLLRQSYRNLAKSASAINANANQQAEGNTLLRAANGSLVGIHNISEEKLRKVIKQGGSANPSTAVIDIERQSFDSYGDISFIMPSSLVDAGTGRNAGTFTADAWTPTYPQVTKRFSDDKLQRAYWRDVSAIPEEMSREVRMAFDSWLDDRNASGLAYMFLHERGEAPEMVRVAAKFPQDIKDKLSAILGENRSGLYELSDEEKQAVLDLYIQENFGGNREEFDKSITDRIQRIEDRLSTGKVPSFVEKRITLDLQWMKEHAYDYNELSKFVNAITADIRHAGEVNDAATTNRALDYIKDNGLEKEFDKWKESLNDRYGIKQYLFDGYTPSGNQRWLPNTVENASRLMNKQGLAGATGMAVSFNRFVATLAPKKKTLSEIRASKDRLVEDDKLVDDFREKWSEVFFDLGVKCQPNAKGYEDYGLERLTEAAQKKNPGAYLKKEYGVELSQEDLQKLAEMIKAIKTEFPARYFETKFQRPVYLNEFAAAVMPTTTSEDIKQAVSEAGLPIFEYDSSVEGSRKEATLKATEGEGIRFRTAPSDRVLSLFNQARAGELGGKPISIGSLTKEGKEYLERISGIKLKENVSFVLNPSDLNHIYNDHYGKNEKDTGNNIPLNDYDIRRLVDVISFPTRVVFGEDKQGRKVFYFLSETPSGTYNLMEIYANKKGNLTAKTYYKTKKGATQRVMELESLLSTSETYSGATLSNAKIPILFDIANQEEGNIRFRTSNNNQAIFVSNAAKAVEAIKQEKATPEQWLKMIEKNGGLKAGEDKWMGLSDWLKESDKKTLTKQEVLDFINENMIVIEEEKYGEVELSALQEEFNEIYDNIIDNVGNEDESNLQLWEVVMNPMERAWEELRDRYSGGDDFDMAFSYDSHGNIEVNDPDAAGHFLGVKPIDDIRLDYTTSGLQNKQEIALVVPTIESWNETDEVHFGDAGDGRAVAWIRFGETEAPVQDAAYTRLQKIYDRLSELEMKVSSSTGITHEEYDERSRLRKERDELQKAGTKTQRVLVIDEIQSKRHQEGREKGYKSDFKNSKEAQRLKAEVDRVTARLMELVNDKRENEESELTELARLDIALGNATSNAEYDAILEEQERIRAHRENREAEELAVRGERRELAYLLDKQIDRDAVSAISAVPDAPFDKNWHELAMKRMLRYAAENGYDVIAWTKGDQQAERYDLGESVKSIAAFPVIDSSTEEVSDNVFSVYTLSNTDDNSIIPDASGRMSTEKIMDVFGKDLGNRIIESVRKQGETFIEGEDLRIGGEGMKGFYDKMLPAFMNKYGKKWGVKVEDINLPGLESGLTMHSVPVTEEMKASVMEGQVMFRATGITPEVREEMAEIKESAERAGTYLKAPNGADTNLTAEQWALVRTKAFKAWFGDWELPYKMIDIVRGTMNHGFANFDDAKQWAKDNIVRVYDNEETGGKGNIEISNNAVKKYLSESAVQKSDSKNLHLAVMKVLPSVIRNGVIAETHADYMKDENGERTAESKINPDVTIHRVYGAVRIGDDIYRVKVTLKEHKDANRANTPHSYEATKIELLAGTLVGAKGSNPNTNNSISAANLLKEVEKSYESGKYLLDDYSKVVDENGEPMVVYHGTDKDFNIFDIHTDPHKSFTWKIAHFGTKEQAEDILRTSKGAKRLMEVFLNIRNPYRISDQEDNDSWRYAAKQAANGMFADQNGVKADGLVYLNEYEGKVPADSYAVWNPSQIKSATDNTGEFSAEDNDIRFRTRYDVNTNPTEAQKKAGNYKMGHLRLDGYNITIENPKGSVRRGTDSKGNAWENTLNNDYGYIRGTEGVDGDHIDVYLSDNPAEGNVFVIDQVNPETREFDEHKVMYGFNSAEEAREAYLANFSEGWNGLGTITEVTKDEFRKWIESSHRKTKPFSEYKSVNILGSQSEEIDTAAEEDIVYTTGTPTEDVVARGLELSRQDAARLAGDIYSIMPADIRKQVSAEALNNGMDLQKTIFQISASLAEKDSLSDEETAFAKSVADILEQRLLDDGVEMTRPLTTPEALWMLWRNSNPVGEDDVFGAARRAVVADNLGMSTRFRAADKRNDSDNRSKQFREATASAAADAYNRSVSFWKNRLKESYVDNMDSVNILVEAIEKASGKAAQGWEDIRLTMNQLSSKGLSAMEKFIRDYLHPMWDAVEAIMKKMDIDKADVERYIMLESGLERNEVFAKRDAKAKHQDEYDKQIRSIEGMEVTDEEKAALKVKAKNTLDRRLAAVDAGTDATYKKMRERDYGAVMAQFAEYAPIKDQSAYGSLEEYNRAKLNSRRLKYSTVEEAESAAWEEINAFRQKAGEELIDNLWKRINAATKATLKQQYEANMLSKAQYDHIRGMFKYYVPMRGFADNTAEDMYSYYANGQNDFAAPVLKAKGRTTMAESPLGHIGAMASSGIAQGLKNEAKLALYYFVLNRPNDLISVDKTWYVDTGRADEEGKAIFEAKYPPMTGALSEEKARADYEKWQNEMKELEKQGKAVRGSRKLDLKNSVIHITPSSAKEHTITVKVGGEEITMFINGNPRAAQAVNGLLNIEASDKFEGMRKYLRFLSSVNTSFNPEFWMTNLQRDILFTAMAISSKEDAQYNKTFRENYWKAWKAVTMVRKNKKGTLGDSHVEQLFKEFVENGGPTGYTKVIGNEEWEKTMNKYLSRKDRPKAESIRKAFDALQSFSEGIEQVSRFAAYMTSREMGRSVQQSISDAKEVTVNFNRKGSGQEITKEEVDKLTDENGQPLSELSKFCIRMISKISPYGRGFLMFFNASVQGLNSFVRLTKNNPKAMSIWASGYLMLGILNASLHAMLDDDDEYLDIPDYERRTSLLLGGNGAYFKWALPQEARAFYALGDLFVNRTLDRMPHQNVIWEATKILFDVAPLNPTEGIAGVLPPYVATVVELATNKDYKGAKIYKDMAYLSDEAKKGVPEYTKTFSGTSEVAVALSRVINWLSGGDYATSGYLDGFLTNPAVMQHVVESQLGGTLRTINKALDTIWNIGGLAVGAEDAEFTVRNTPFLNRLLTINDERYRNSHTTDLYKHYKGVAANAKRREKEYSAAHDSENLNSLRSSEDYAVFQIYQRHKKVLDMYDKQLKLARNEQERRLIMQRQDAERKRMIEEISRL